MFNELSLKPVALLITNYKRKGISNTDFILLLIKQINIIIYVLPFCIPDSC